MILRRLSHSLREQNWVAIGIEFGPTNRWRHPSPATVFSHFHVDVLQRLGDRAGLLLRTLEEGGSECFEDGEDSL